MDQEELATVIVTHRLRSWSSETGEDDAEPDEGVLILDKD